MNLNQRQQIILKVFFFCFAVLSITTASAQQKAHPAEVKATSKNAGIFLKCNFDSDPVGLHDVYIDHEAKTFIDSFGVVTPYQEKGPFLIAEKYEVANPIRKVSSSHRINRFTLEFTSLFPALGQMKSGQCIAFEKSF